MALRHFASSATLLSAGPNLERIARSFPRRMATTFNDCSSLSSRPQTASRSSGITIGNSLSSYFSLRSSRRTAALSFPLWCGTFTRGNSTKASEFTKPQRAVDPKDGSVVPLESDSEITGSHTSAASKDVREATLKREPDAKGSTENVLSERGVKFLSQPSREVRALSGVQDLSPPPIGDPGWGNIYTLAGWGLFALFLFPMVAAAYSVERNRNLVESKSGRFGWLSTLSDKQRMEDAWRQKLANQFGSVYAMFSKAVDVLPKGGQDFLSYHFLKGADWIINLPTYQLSILPVLALNTIVFIAWRIPSPFWQSFLFRGFISTTDHCRFFTLITAAFSHQTAAHFALNQLALFSVGSVALDSVSKRFPKKEVERLERENLTRDGVLLPEVDSSMKVLSFYIGAAFVSGLVSWSSRRGCRAVAKHLSSRRSKAMVCEVKPVPTVNPSRHWSDGPALGTNSTVALGSLGASGVVYALFILNAITHPESRMGIIFLPERFAVDARDAMVLLLAFDTVALIVGSIFAKSTGLDHVAHLAGAAFGVAWYHLSLYKVWEYGRRLDPRKVSQRYLGFGGDPGGSQVVK